MLRVGALAATIVMALALAHSANSAVMIGNASTVVREVKSTLETRERILIVDDDVFQDEEVTTGVLSAARLIFKDGTNMAMGAQSRLKLTKVLFDPDPSKSKVAMRAALGVFRMATGNLPHSAYQVATPVATISVRGTIIEFTVSGIGTTTVYVARGAATVRSNNGDEVDLEAGQSTTVRAEGVGNNIVAGSPTDPGAPSEDFAKQVRAMTVTLRSDEPATDQLPGGGFFRAAPPGNPFPLRPPPSRNGGGGPGSGPIGGSGTGAPSGGSSSGNSSSGNSNPPSNGGGGDAIHAKVETAVRTSQQYTRVGATSGTIVTIARVDSDLGEIVGTLAGSTGIFSGPGSGRDGVRLLQGGEMEFTYVFAPTAAGTYRTALPYDFPGYGVSGVVELIGEAINPTLTVNTKRTGGSSGGVGAQATRTGAFSQSVRIANDTPDVAPIDIVGVTILSAYLEGEGADMFTISGLDPGAVLGAGEETFLTISLDPTQEGADEWLATLGEVQLYILTDLNAAFGSAGSLLNFRLSFADDDPVAIVAPPVGIILLAGGSLFLLAGRKRRRL